jgi:MerR family transcriptional regulator, aldehyde-responsive regulator
LQPAARFTLPSMPDCLQPGAEVGLSAATVRYYERLGLLPPAERTAAGDRQYHQDAVERLRFIKCA